MKKLMMIGALIGVAMGLNGCSNDAVECGDSVVTDLLTEILTDELQQELSTMYGKTPEEKRTNYLNFITRNMGKDVATVLEGVLSNTATFTYNGFVVQRKNDTTKKIQCLATREISHKGAKIEAEIVYSAQPTEDEMVRVQLLEVH